MTDLTFLHVYAALVLVALAETSYGEVFGGIDFPDGASSFADHVVTYDPVAGGGAPRHLRVMQIPRPML